MAVTILAVYYDCGCVTSAGRRRWCGRCAKGLPYVPYLGFVLLA